MGGSFLFVFEPHVSLADAEMSLHLAMFAVEGLVGRVQVRLDAKYQIDADTHAIVINSGNRVSQMIVRVFAGLLHREIGEDAFHVEQVNSSAEQTRASQLPQEVQA